MSRWQHKSFSWLPKLPFLALIALDLLILNACAVFSLSLITPHELFDNSVRFIALNIVTSVALILFGVCNPALKTSLVSLLVRCCYAVFLMVVGFSLIIFIQGPGSIQSLFGRGVLGLVVGLFFGYLLISRFLLFKLVIKKHLRERLAVLSNIALFNELTNDVQRHPSKSSLMLTHVDDHKLSLDFDGYVIGDDHLSDPTIAAQVLQLKLQGKRIMNVKKFYELYLEKTLIGALENDWLVNTEGFGFIYDALRQRTKRFIDLTICLLTLPLTLLLYTATYWLIRLVDKSEPLFRQRRIGIKGQVFTIYKFRTMVNSAENNGQQWSSNDDRRITSLGAILRKYRLDEIPQIINVIRGDMSLIGPRPEQPKLCEELQNKIPFYGIRHSIRPGISGWAQVMYGYGSSVDDAREKLQYDLYYIKHYSLQLDLVIIIKTIYTIISGQGR